MAPKATKNGTTSEETPTVSGELAPTFDGSEVTAFVKPVTGDWLQGVDIERVTPLEVGAGIEGVFLGKGGPVDVTDPATGEVRALDTWRIKVAPRIVLRLLDGARLKGEFTTKPVDGSVRVRVGKLGSVKTKRGMNVTDYFVGYLAPDFRFPWESKQGGGAQ